MAKVCKQQWSIHALHACMSNKIDAIYNFMIEPTLLSLGESASKGQDSSTDGPASPPQALIGK